MNRNCPRCTHSIDYLASTCDGCGADIAVELEIQAFHQPAIDSARKMILFAGMLYPAIPILLFAVLGQIAGAGVFATAGFALSLGIGLAIFAGHVGLWWWAKKSPLVPTAIALAVFVAYVVATGASGWLVKVVGLVLLTRAVIASWRVRKLRLGGASATEAQSC